MRKIQIAFIALFLLGVIAMLALQSDWGKKMAQQFLLEALAESGYKVEIGQIEGTLPHAIDLKNVKIESDTLDISIDSVETRLSLLGLIKKEILFTDVKASGISYQLKPGALPTFGKGKGLSFAVRVKHFQLTDVAVSEGVDANFEGALRIGKKNRNFYLNISGTRPEFSESKVHLIAYLDESGSIRVKGSLKSPTLQAISLPFPVDAAADLQFSFRGKKDFFGHIFGTISPHSIEREPVAVWLEKDWKIDSRIVFSQGWEINRFTASTDQIKLSGNGKFDRKGQFEAASLAIKGIDPEILAKFDLTAADDGAIAVKGNGSAAKLPFDSILSLENPQGHLDFLWKNQAIAGNGVASAQVNGKTWKGKTDFSWEYGDSLFLRSAELQGPSTHVLGDLEIRPDKILIGQTDLNIENLQDVSSDLYGSLKGKTDWLITDGKQVLTADLIATGFYWKDFFAEKVSIDASVINPFSHPQGRAVFDAGEIKWRQMFLNHLKFETLVGTPNWPFALSVSGKWKHPLELNLTGIWHYQDSHFTSTLQTLTGSFYKHPITLKQEVDIEAAPDLFRINGLELSLSNARAYLLIEEIKNEFTSKLVLEQFPLDVLSLNPLDVVIAGQTDLTISMNEKNGKVDGALSAAIHQMEIGTLEETPPLSASGRFDGRFDRDRLDVKGGLEMQGNPLLTLDLSIPIHIETMPPSASFVYDQQTQGHLALKGRIEEILDFFDLGTHRVEGDINCDFHLSNTLQEPDITGTLHFEKGYYENYLTGTRLLDIAADGKASKDQFILDTFTANDGKGILSATGEIGLRPTEYFPFLFDISFSRFNVAQIDLVSVEAEGQIEITGTLKGATARGQVELIESDLQIPDRIPRSVPNLVVVYRNAVKPIELPQIDAKEPYPLKLDLEVRAPERININGRGLDSEWKGNFHLGGTFTSYAAEGKLELIKGEFVFSGRRFKLLEGALSFTGKEHEMPYLNLAAQIEIKEISITARLKGPLNNPQLTLQSVPPLPLSTIMSYLLFGQELAEINSFQALQLANSLASLAGQGPDVLENTRKALGVDRLNIVSLPSGDIDVEDTIALQVGKYISEGVLVSYTQSAEDASANISIEIELKSGWVVELESDQRQEQGKFTIKWNHNY